MLTCVAGIAFSIMLKRVFPFFAAIALGITMSWLRVFVLVALACSYPGMFRTLHDQGGFVVFLAAVACLSIIVLRVKGRECNE
jgi:exosortase/archaeosortase family protein